MMAPFPAVRARPTPATCVFASVSWSGGCNPPHNPRTTCREHRRAPRPRRRARPHRGPRRSPTPPADSRRQPGRTARTRASTPVVQPFSTVTDEREGSVYTVNRGEVDVNSGNIAALFSTEHGDPLFLEGRGDDAQGRRA